MAKCHPEVALSEPGKSPSPSESIQPVTRAAAALAARLKPLAGVKPGAASAFRDLEQALDTLGDATTFSAALSDTVAQGRELVRQSRAERAVNLRTAMAGFIRDVEVDTAVRETALGWRVGRIELELRPDEGVLRSLYDREPLTTWTPILGASDVRTIFASSENLLDKAEIAEDRLVVAFLEAYQYLAARQEGMNLVSRRIALADLLDEIRVVLARTALKSKKRKDAEAAIQMPRWALLYNADRYRASAAGFAPDQRLMFETGSTRETEKIGVTMNGLDAARDYERFCYVRRALGS